MLFHIEDSDAKVNTPVQVYGFTFTTCWLITYIHPKHGKMTPFICSINAFQTSTVSFSVVHSMEPTLPITSRDSPQVSTESWLCLFRNSLPNVCKPPKCMQAINLTPQPAFRHMDAIWAHRKNGAEVWLNYRNLSLHSGSFVVTSESTLQTVKSLD